MHSENPRSKKPLYLRHHRLHLNLPEEIIEEILSRLPVKSLLRFRCVSKSWLSLVESNRFIKIHYQNSTKNTSLAHHILNVFRGCFRCYSLQSLLNSNSKKGSSSSSCNNISIAYPTDRRGMTIVVGCCNGLLCILSTIPNPGYVFWLWNPATKVRVELPHLLGFFSLKFGFGWDESSGAFKVFATTEDDYDTYKTIGHVYSSKTNSWKTVTYTPPRLESNNNDYYLFNYLGVFVCGRIHWFMQLHDKQYVIESFNLENDEFERIELPPSLIYGIPPLFGECGLNGEIFITCTDKLMVYSPKDGHFSKTADLDLYRALVYVESLVPPPRITTIRGANT